MLTPTFDGNAAAAASDEVLIAAITDHQPEALSELYSRHGSRLKSIIGNVVHEEGEADDVLQEILLQVWRDASHYSPKTGRLLAWIVTVARRRAIDRLRRKQAYCRVKERYQTQLEQQTQVTAQARAADTEIERADLRRFLHRRLQNLPRYQREAIELAFFAGMSHREIAAATRAPLGTVKTRIRTGMMALRSQLQQLAMGQ